MHSKFIGRSHEMQQLKNAWKLVADKNNPKPQLITLLGESGLGKTRIAQEFYNWLSTHVDATQPRGYWPDNLGQKENNLKVNPDFSKCQNEQPFPYLWWALRLADKGGHNIVGGSAIHDYQRQLVQHLEVVFNRVKANKRTKDAGKSFANAVVDIGLGFIPFGNILSPLKTAVAAITKLSSITLKHIQESQVLSTEELDQRENQSVQDLLIDALDGLFSTGCPACILIDDAQFSRDDLTLTSFFNTLLSRAWQQDWPLLLIVTHWEKEWHEEQESKQLSIATVIHKHEFLKQTDWQPQLLGPVEDLSPMLQQVFKGLQLEQIQVLTERTGGNPRFMNELIYFCQRNPRYFLQRDNQQPLNKKGLQACINTRLKLHDLIEDRLYNAPEAVKQAVSLSSLQGQRFLTQLTIEISQRLQLSLDQTGLLQAERPHSFINNAATEVADFAQRVFYEVAKETVENVADRDQAEDCLKSIIGKRLRNIMQLKNQTFLQQEITYQLAIDVFEQSEDIEDKFYAAIALVELVQIELERYDHQMAVTYALRFMQGVQAGSWSLQNFTLYKIDSLRVALEKMGELQKAHTLSIEMLTIGINSVKENNSLSARHQLVITYLHKGYMDKLIGNHNVALEAYQKALDISKELADEFGFYKVSAYGLLGSALNTFRVFNNLEKHQQSVDDNDSSLQSYGKFLESCELLRENSLDMPKILQSLAYCYTHIGEENQYIGDYVEALQAYQESLEIRKSLANEIKTSQATRDLLVIYNKIGEIRRLTRNNVDALQFYHQALELTKQLAKKLNTPESRRDLLCSYDRISEVEISIGKHAEALKTSYKFKEISEQLAKELNTPEAQRDLSVAHQRIGNIKQNLGYYVEASLAYQIALGISEQLANKFNTPEARRDLSSIYVSIGNLEKINGDIELALKSYQKSIQISKKLIARGFNAIKVQEDLRLAYHGVGELAQTKGDYIAASHAYQKMLEISEKLANELNVPQERYMFWEYCRIAGTLEERIGNNTAQLEICNKFLNLNNEKAFVDELSTPDDLYSLAEFYHRAGTLNESIFNFTEALRVFQKALAIDKLLVKKTGTTKALHDMWSTYYKITEMEEYLENYQAAENSCLKTIEISEQLADENFNQETIQDISYSYEKMLIIYNRTGNLEAAAQTSQKLLKILSRTLSNSELERFGLK